MFLISLYEDFRNEQLKDRLKDVDLHRARTNRWIGTLTLADEYRMFYRMSKERIALENSIA